MPVKAFELEAQLFEQAVRRQIVSGARLSMMVASWVAMLLVVLLLVPFLRGLGSGPWPALAGFILLVGFLVLVPGAVSLGAVLATSLVRARRAEATASAFEMRVVVVERLAVAIARELGEEKRRQFAGRHSEELKQVEDTELLAILQG